MRDCLFKGDHRGVCDYSRCSTTRGDPSNDMEHDDNTKDPDYQYVASMNEEPNKAPMDDDVIEIKDNSIVDPFF